MGGGGGFTTPRKRHGPFEPGLLSLTSTSVLPQDASPGWGDKANEGRVLMALKKDGYLTHIAYYTVV